MAWDFLICSYCFIITGISTFRLKMSSEPSSSYAAGLKGAELSKWLENKLGPSDDLWCSRNICAHLSQEILANCQTCFVDLQTSVKLKLLLSFIHLGRRNLELVSRHSMFVLFYQSIDSIFLSFFI